jgi:hypothetical protein
LLFCYVLEVPLERIGAMARHFQLPFWRARRPSTLDVYVGLVVLAGLLVCGALLGDALWLPGTLTRRCGCWRPVCCRRRFCGSPSGSGGC